MNEVLDKSERVNHPSHYQGANGIETIDVIRHYVCDIANAQKYLMRAGKKTEMGMDDIEKEIEDLRKAVFYIEDYKNMSYVVPPKEEPLKKMLRLITLQTGYNPAQIAEGYDEQVGSAIRNLLCVGLVSGNIVSRVANWESYVNLSIRCIKQRISDISNPK